MSEQPSGPPATGEPGRLSAAARDLAERLLSLPSETDRNYELGILDTVRVNPLAMLKPLREVLMLGPSDGTDDSAAFNAFYCLCTIHRRQQDGTEFESLVRECEQRFAAHPMFHHLKAMSLIRSSEMVTHDERIRLLQRAKRSVERTTGVFRDRGMSPPAGVLNNLAELTASLWEVDSEITGAELSTALHAIDDAIDERPEYAKYYATKARLQMASGAYEQASISIRMAIDMEDKFADDYSLRLMDFQKYYMIIQLAGAKNEFKRDVDETKSQLARFEGQNVAFLGFFAGIVSFIIGSVQLIRGQSAGDAALLIMVMGGMLAGVYALLTVVLNSRGRHWWLPVLLVGVFGGGLALVAALILGA